MHQLRSDLSHVISKSKDLDNNYQKIIDLQAKHQGDPNLFHVDNCHKQADQDKSKMKTYIDDMTKKLVSLVDNDVRQLVNDLADRERDINSETDGVDTSNNRFVTLGFLIDYYIGQARNTLTNMTKYSSWPELNGDASFSASLTRYINDSTTKITNLESRIVNSRAFIPLIGDVIDAEDKVSELNRERNQAIGYLNQINNLATTLAQAQNHLNNLTNIKNNAGPKKQYIQDRVNRANIQANFVALNRVTQALNDATLHVNAIDQAFNDATTKFASRQQAETLLQNILTKRNEIVTDMDSINNELTPLNNANNLANLRQARTNANSHAAQARNKITQAQNLLTQIAPLSVNNLSPAQLADLVTYENYINNANATATTNLQSITTRAEQRLADVAILEIRAHISDAESSLNQAQASISNIEAANTDQDARDHKQRAENLVDRVIQELNAIDSVRNNADVQASATARANVAATLAAENAHITQLHNDAVLARNDATNELNAVLALGAARPYLANINVNLGNADLERQNIDRLNAIVGPRIDDIAIELREAQDYLGDIDDDITSIRNNLASSQIQNSPEALRRANAHLTQAITIRDDAENKVNAIIARHNYITKLNESKIIITTKVTAIKAELLLLDPLLTQLNAVSVRQIDGENLYTQINVIVTRINNDITEVDGLNTKPDIIAIPNLPQAIIDFINLINNPSWAELKTRKTDQERAAQSRITLIRAIGDANLALLENMLVQERNIRDQLNLITQAQDNIARAVDITAAQNADQSAADHLTRTENLVNDLTTNVNAPQIQGNANAQQEAQRILDAANAVLTQVRVARTAAQTAVADFADIVQRGLNLKTAAENARDQAIAARAAGNALLADQKQDDAKNSMDAIRTLITNTNNTQQKWALRKHWIKAYEAYSDAMDPTDFANIATARIGEVNLSCYVPRYKDISDENNNYIKDRWNIPPAFHTPEDFIRAIEDKCKEYNADIRLNLGQSKEAKREDIIRDIKRNGVVFNSPITIGGQAINNFAQLSARMNAYQGYELKTYIDMYDATSSLTFDERNLNKYRLWPITRNIRRYFKKSSSLPENVWPRWNNPSDWEGTDAIDEGGPTRQFLDSAIDQLKQAFKKHGKNYDTIIQATDRDNRLFPLADLNYLDRCIDDMPGLAPIVDRNANRNESKINCLENIGFAIARLVFIQGNQLGIDLTPNLILSLQGKDINSLAFHELLALLYIIDKNDEFKNSIKNDYSNEDIQNLSWEFSDFDSSDNREVTQENVIEYLEKDMRKKLKPKEFTHIIDGFNKLVIASDLSGLNINEIRLAIGGVAHTKEKVLAKVKISLSLASVTRDVTANNAYQWVKDALMELMTENDGKIISPLLGFWTGSSLALPPSGKDLNINVIPARDISHLPKSHTCFETIDISNYDNKDILKQKLKRAIELTGAGFDDH